MTDTRIPDRWLIDRRMSRLTDRGFRAFISALVWSVTSRTDGHIEPEDLHLIPGFANCAEDELLAAGVLVPDGTGWLISEFAETQTSKAELDALSKAREANRIRQANWRANRRHSDSNVTNVTPTTQAGKAGRQGPALPTNGNNGCAREKCPDCDGSGWVRDTDPAIKCTHPRVGS